MPRSALVRGGTGWPVQAAGNQTKIGITGYTSTFGDRNQITQMASTPMTYFGNGNTDRLTSNSLSFENGALGLMDRTDGSTTDHRYTRTPDGAALGYKTIDNVRLYYATDNLGSIVGIFNSQGVYLGGYSYSPYGEDRGIGANSVVQNNNLRYIGELYVGTGTYKFGARYYEAPQGRFSQYDPSGQERNPYLYVGCNPIDSKDPTGLDSCGDFAFGVGLAAAGVVEISADTFAGVISAAPSFGAGAVAAGALATVIAGQIAVGVGIAGMNAEDCFG